MYRTDLNNYYQKPKSSNIQTPKEVSQFIFELLKNEIPSNGLIFDPCSGQNSLLWPWWTHRGHPIWGNDNDPSLLKTEISNSDLDFLTSEKYQWESYFSKQRPSLVLCNPPFNGLAPKLAPEVWLDKIIELFGKEVPIVLFAPVGFFGNLTLTSKRKMKFENGVYPAISSIISLPMDVFEGVKFHSQILIFNIKGLQSHYFYKPNE